MTRTDVTIVVVPRQRFNQTIFPLESIYAQTQRPFKLIYIDGGSPPRVARYLRSQAKLRGFTLVRSNHFLSPNESRNLALAHVQTQYIGRISGWVARRVTEKRRHDVEIFEAGPQQASESLPKTRPQENAMING